MRLGVERLLDDAIGRRGREVGDLEAQLVGAPAEGCDDVGVGLGVQLGDLEVQAGPPVGEQGLTPKLESDRRS